MCGIVGLFAKSPAIEDRLGEHTAAMLRQMSDRGPDSAGVAVYRWLDLNSDHFAQADEVQLNQFVASAGGFNPANPTAVTSANRIDPNLKAPVTQSIVAGLERELRSNLSVQVNGAS